MEAYRKMKIFINRSFLAMDKQIQQLTFESEVPPIEDALEVFIADIVKVILAFARDPTAIITENFNVHDEGRLDYKIQQLQSQIDANHAT